VALGQDPIKPSLLKGGFRSKRIREMIREPRRCAQGMRKCLVALVISLALFGCAESKRRIPTTRYAKPAVVLPHTTKPYPVNGVSYYPLPSKEGFVQEGIASWYGKEFHRRKTSSGEIYNMYDKTAAHKTLPFGTYVKVENLSNSEEVVVRVNDRGPFVKQRIIDLSYGAAKDIALIGPGTARVRLVALSREVGKIKSGNTRTTLVEAKDFNKGKFTVQVGAFEKRENAERLAGRLRVIFGHVTITPYEPYAMRILYRVRVSLSENMTEADKAL
jgi:rare lipoprotein A